MHNDVTPQQCLAITWLVFSVWSTVELCFLRWPCRGCIMWVHLQLRWVLVEFRGSGVIEQEMARRLHSDLKWLLLLLLVGWTYVTRYCGHFWPIVQPQMIDVGDCGVIGGMKIGRGNRSTWRNPAPVTLCPPQIPIDQTRARTQAAAVGSQRLTAWAMARPWFEVIVSVLRSLPGDD
jgi:hypothetical protein